MSVELLNPGLETGHPDRAPSIVPSRTRATAEIALAFLAALAFYFALYGQLPYHDAARFAAQVDSGKYVWDIGHILLQPATLLWHRYLRFGEAAEVSQKHISTFATALAIAVFYALLLRLRVPAWQRILASLLVAASCSVIILAPSGHMKLVAFPFVNGALYCTVLWEQRRNAQPAPMSRTGPDGMLTLGAVLLAVAAAFLASALATAPFACLAILLAGRRAGDSWGAAFRRATLFALFCGGLFLLIVGLGFIAFAHQPLTLHGLAASVEDKAALKPATYSLVTNLVRLGFATVNNFIGAPVLGSVGRAWISGQVPSLRPYAAPLLEQILPWLLTLLLLAVIYVRAIVAAVKGAACLVPLAFLCGAQAWTIYYKLNDPEHWFQLTAPTVLLFLMLFPRRAVQTALPLWSVLTVAVNLAVIAVPQAAYPLARNEALLRTLYTPRDLLVSFAAYPGKPYLGFFDLPGVPRLKLDQVLASIHPPAAALARADQRIDQTLAQGGKVVVFGAFDPEDWDAPWSDLTAHGMPKAKLLAHFRSTYNVVPLGLVGGMKAWQILPRGA